MSDTMSIISRPAAYSFSSKEMSAKALSSGEETGGKTAGANVQTARGLAGSAVGNLVLPQGMQQTVSASASEGAGFPPDIQINSEDVAKNIVRLQEARTVFSGSTLVLADSQKLGRILIELGGLQRTAMLEGREADRLQAKGEMFSQAAKVEKSANDTQKATLLNAAVTIGISMAALGGSAYALRGVTKDLKPMKGAAPDAAPMPTPAAAGGATATGRPGASAIDDSVPAGLPTSSIRTGDKRNLQEAPAELDGGDVAPVARPVAANERDSGIPVPASNIQNGGALDQGLEISKNQQKTSAIMAMTSSIGAMAGAAGGVASMNSTQEAKLADADASREAAKAEETKGEGDVQHEFQQSLSATLTALIDFFEKINEAELGRLAAMTKG